LSAAVNGGTNSSCRWRLPDAAEQKRLAPLWRSASLAVWHGDTWRMIRSTDGALGEENENDGVWMKPKPMLPFGTYVVVTAHNPMGQVTDRAVNEANARDLAHAVSVVTPAPAAVPDFVQIKKLHELLTCGALTAEEFAALKRKVIAA